MNKHPNDMSADELRKLVWNMAWVALDLAQHLYVTNKLLKDEHKGGAYEKECLMAHNLASLNFQNDSSQDRGHAVIIDDRGLTRHNITDKELQEVFDSPTLEKTQ